MRFIPIASILVATAHVAFSAPVYSLARRAQDGDGAAMILIPPSNGVVRRDGNEEQDLLVRELFARELFSNGPDALVVRRSELSTRGKQHSQSLSTHAELSEEDPSGEKQESKKEPPKEEPKTFLEQEQELQVHPHRFSTDAELGRRQFGQSNTVLMFCFDVFLSSRQSGGGLGLLSVCARDVIERLTAPIPMRCWWSLLCSSNPPCCPTYSLYSQITRNCYIVSSQPHIPDFTVFAIGISRFSNAHLTTNRSVFNTPNTRLYYSSIDIFHALRMPPFLVIFTQFSTRVHSLTWSRNSDFAASAKTTLAQRRKVTLALEQHNSLLDILQISQLIDTCVRNGYWSEAMDLSAHTAPLLSKSPTVPVIIDTVAEAE
ncbi:hypothetical protein K439DRAFT_636239 [Ramaria rubella]|nr:hypothetical protein K439DRAFT_636239 [Ramaria rubella]